MLHKLKVLSIVCIAIIFSFMPIIQASAAPQLEVKATSGFQNKVKYGKGLPLTITVVNSGDAFSGDLVLDYTESYAVGSAQAIPFEIGAGETKTLQLSLPGLTDQYMYSGTNFQMFHFYEDSWKDGKEIDYKGSKYVKPNMLDPMSTFILTLTNSADRLRAFSNVNVQPINNQTQLIHVAQMKDFILPSDAAAWDSANFLVIDEYVLSDLSEAQQQAILGWIQNGGIVVVGASENTAAEMGMLSEHLPLNLSMDRMTVSPDVFANSANNEGFIDSITSFKATRADGANVLLEVPESVLAAYKSYGQGYIVQTAFSLGDEPLSKQPGYSTFLSELLKKLNIPSYNNRYNYGQNVKEQMVYEVGYTNELFPSFKVSTPLMFGIIGIYILLVGPLMYVLLKRKDKREHAWWIIPIIAVITSLAIFAYGAKDRLVKPQVQQSSILQVNEDQSLSGYYVESILSNRSGNFTFEAPIDTTMTTSLNNQFNPSTISAFQKSVIEQNVSSSNLTLRNVGYWSVNSIIGQTFIKDAGKLTIQLVVENGDVKGTIQNNFPFALKDVSIWSGSKRIELGDLSPGDTMDVHKKIGSTMLVPAMSSYNNYYYNYGQVKADELIKTRKDNLLRMTNAVTGTNTQPAIVAYTEDAIVPVVLKDSKVEMSNVNVIFQTFTPETHLSGEFTLPSNSLTFDLTSLAPTYYERIGQSELEYHMEDGDYKLIWSVPPSMPISNVKWNELQVVNTSTNSLSVEILNVKKNEHEEVPKARFTLNENVQDYISKEGKVELLIHKKMVNGDGYTKLPELRLKGVVQ